MLRYITFHQKFSIFFLTFLKKNKDNGIELKEKEYLVEGYSLTYYNEDFDFAKDPKKEGQDLEKQVEDYISNKFQDFVTLNLQKAVKIS